MKIILDFNDRNLHAEDQVLLKNMGGEEIIIGLQIGLEKSIKNMRHNKANTLSIQKSEALLAALYRATTEK